MSVIIRLQNLPWTANARDIRNFFTGLSIPEGGVHIIGGEMGDAFIAFSTDEDARCAMLKDREKLMEVQVRLLLSSRAEMQKVIETARKKASVPTPITVAAAAPAALPQAPQPPVIGGLNSFLPQNSKQAPQPSYLAAYQQQAGVKLSDVIIVGSKSPERGRHGRSGRQRGRSRSRSLSRSRSSSSDDSFDSRDRERARKRRSDRADSRERVAKSQSNIMPWALGSTPTTVTTGVDPLAALKMTTAGGGVGLQGLSPLQPVVLPSYTTNTTTNNYNLSVGSNAGATLPLPMLAALKAVATGGVSSGDAITAQVPGVGLKPAASLYPTLSEPQKSGAVAATAPAVSTQEPIAFANVNPYAQMYPQLFQQQQLLLQQQSSPKASASVPASQTNCPTAETCYVKISGMCPSTTYSDLRKYFAGLYIPHNGIRFCNPNGARSGVAYIEFSRVSSAQKALARNNTMFRDRQVQIVPVSDDEFEQAESRSNSGGAGHISSGGEGSHNRSPIADTPSNVLYVEDLPQLTTEQDIMKMFSATYSIVDILLAPSPNNRREFVAFVLFARENEARSALEDTGCHYIGFRRLRVRASSSTEMQSAKEKLRRANEQLLKEEQLMEEKANELLAQANNSSDAVSSINGISTGAKYNADPRRRADRQRDRESNESKASMQSNAPPAVMPMNSVPPFVNNNLQNGGMPPFGMNSPTGIGNHDPFAVNFNHNNHNQGPSNGPFQNNNNNNGPFQSNNNNGPFHNNYNNNNGSMDNNGQLRRRGDEDHFVRVHNCEYGTRINDLGEFFMTENLNIVHIEMLYNERNMPAGEFLVEFADSQNAKTAIREFHNRRFRGRGLRVVHITPQEIADRLRKPFMDYVPGGNGPRQSDIPSSTQQQPQQQQQEKQPQQSRRRGPSRFDDASNRSNNNEDNDNAKQPPQNPFNPFAKRPVEDAPALGTADIIVPAALCGGGGGAAAAVSSPPLDDGIPDKFDRPGCVVAMRNVPFKADLKDILRFFSDYKLSPHDIIRRFNDEGKPTGDARVAFESPAEARSAFESRRRRQIFNRNVYLEII
ncbi:uncharacterized protein LOC115632895 [Scaptodrosophila lebanonensis]|uniref:Uncharacterized protein LOC115632895 n=1 Tax=Drosophila lebanonensis TaxID=7225 RepID=A0A6J2UC38_DROLE|nr:uncharacterized protein LOC115632895 [Scaptodrosophila lebanonensis]XP_030386046.1 uncharacterized protein LOC115632895 [Scaptodrosophila lebanonensis]